MSQSQETAGNVPSARNAKLTGVRLYFAILATIYVVASLVLGIVGVATIQNDSQTMQSNSHKIEQLQKDTNDNLCNQQEYDGDAACEGGDANGGYGF